MTEPKKRKTAARYREDWLDRKWRPAMGWMYFVVCITDFIVFPVLWSILMKDHGNVITAWEPLTLKGGGLFHVAMGAVLGVAAWSRGQEKITKYQNGYYNKTGEDDGYGNEFLGESLEVREETPESISHTANTGFYRYNG